MAEYTRSELLNEVSKVFRASLSPGREGGTLNTATEYQQMLEMASITLLLNPDAVFHIARLAANQLTATALQEIAVLEDLLVSLDDLGQIGSPVRDTTTLSNARTAALALDAAESVSNRPEAARFTQHMDTFAAQLRKNLISAERGGQFVRPREEARDLIRVNLTTLEELHTSLLSGVVALRDLLTDFMDQDLPSRVSSSVLSSVSSRLQAAITEIGASTDTSNLAANRRLFLETLANKISVKVLSTFSDPSDVKYRSPKRPVPSTLKHTGRVRGQGTPAYVLTNAGPWDLPVSAPLVLTPSGGTPITLNLDSLVGAVLNCRNSQNYVIPSTARQLHVSVDDAVRQGTVVASAVGMVVLSGYMPLGFKHLGSPVSFPDANYGIDPTDLQMRCVTDLRALQSASLFDVNYVEPLVDCSVFTAGAEAGIGFQAHHVGAYLYDLAWGYQFEIIEVLSNTQCIIDNRGLFTDFSGGFILYGESPLLSTTLVQFGPNLTTAPSAGHRVRIGPAVKTAQLTAGTRTAQQVVDDIVAEAGTYGPVQLGAKLNWHIQPELVLGDPTRVALRIRSKLNPTIQITGRFLKTQSPVGPLSVTEESVHTILGYREGERDTTNVLTPSELVNYVNSQAGLSGEVVTTELSVGVVETVATLARVTAPSSTNFSALGVSAGDQIEISDGTVAGTYRITGVVSLSSLDLDRPVFTTKESNLSYRVFREQVKISITDGGAGTSLTVTSAPSELGLTTGTVYSSLTEFEAVDKYGNLLSFDNAVDGDYLKIVGRPEVEITGVSGTTLFVASGLPSNISDVGFEVRSAGAREYASLKAALSTYYESTNLLGKNKFNEGVDAILNACTQATLPGQNFVSSRNQARRYVTDLLAILAAELNRESEYTASVTLNANNLVGILNGYSAADVPALDDTIEMFLDRKYNRAASLLSAGRFTDFYATTSETASYGGAVMAASRAVVKDLPAVSRTREDFLKQRDLARSQQILTDAETDFSDTENEPEDDDL